MKIILVFLNSIISDCLKKLHWIIEKCIPYKNKIFYDNFYKISKDKLLIYSIHIEKKIHNYVLTNINFFEKKGYDILIVLTLNESLKISDISELVNLKNIRILVRKNYGKDFGSFKDAIERISTELNQLKNLVLQNDSLIGPLYNSDFLNQMELLPYDVVGITESLDQNYHLQSSFILIKSSRAINISKNFFETYPVFRSRNLIVKYGEIGLSRYFIKNSLTISSYIPLLELLENYANERLFNKSSNPQHMFMDFIFLNYNFPYLKRDAIKNNPNNYQYDYKNILKTLSKQSKLNLMEALCER